MPLQWMSRKFNAEKTFVTGKSEVRSLVRCLGIGTSLRELEATIDSLLEWRKPASVTDGHKSATDASCPGVDIWPHAVSYVFNCNN